MKPFTLIDDGLAVVRKPKGVFVQTKLYHRDGKIFINAAGGFVRICAKFDDTYTTSHPDYKVLELEGTGVVLIDNKAPSVSWGLR